MVSSVLNFARGVQQVFECFGRPAVLQASERGQGVEPIGAVFVSERGLGVVPLGGRAARDFNQLCSEFLT